MRQHLTAGWHGYQRLTRLGFPPNFQLVQFPNLPLIIGFGLGYASLWSSGSRTPSTTELR